MLSSFRCSAVDDCQLDIHDMHGQCKPGQACVALPRLTRSKQAVLGTYASELVKGETAAGLDHQLSSIRVWMHVLGADHNCDLVSHARACL